MSYRLGINLGFAINKYPEPEVWTRVVRKDLGLRYVQLVADIINPFWPKDYIESQIKRIGIAIKEYDIVVESLFTSAFTRVNHLMSPDPEARQFWLDWFKRFLDIGQRFGAKNAGSHFGIMTFDTYDNGDKQKYILDEAVKGWQELSFYAKEQGYECLIFEPMSVPREMANTIEETKELLARVNAHSGAPLKVCLDVGHAPHPDQRDPYPWIEQLAPVSPIIHLQQTVLHKSNHAPFTEEANKTGIITRERVMDTVKKSGATDVLFAFEISHREHWDTEFRIIRDLKESVDYFRPLITE
ncbi:sugar phosphate isomerase/epimerase family protein [Treponema primitia]|uniref:sugar phosphate isomerase/epimerase family protein n=1 Tax=Treponema primitia TaxID=88058 RepID=UPI0002554EA6|nr:TIM barrel protein [Treponema primitia]